MLRKNCKTQIFPLHLFRHDVSHLWLDLEFIWLCRGSSAFVFQFLLYLDILALFQVSPCAWKKEEQHCWCPSWRPEARKIISVFLIHNWSGMMNHAILFSEEKALERMIWGMFNQPDMSSASREVHRFHWAGSRWAQRTAVMWAIAKEGFSWLSVGCDESLISVF